MKLNYDRPLPNPLPPPPTYTIGDLRATLNYCRHRLHPNDLVRHGRCLDAIGRKLNALELREEIDMTISDLARECYLAGLAAATGSNYTPSRPAIAALLDLVRAHGNAAPAAGAAGEASGQS